MPCSLRFDYADITHYIIIWVIRPWLGLMSTEEFKCQNVQTTDTTSHSQGHFSLDEETNECTRPDRTPHVCCPFMVGKGGVSATDMSSHVVVARATVFWGWTSCLGWASATATQLRPQRDANSGHCLSEPTAVQFDEGIQTVHITPDAFLFSCVLTFPLVYICILLASVIGFGNYRNISRSSSLTKWFFLYYPPIPLMTSH